MADCILFFGRYSNTLLVSLNNRVSIRDTCSARGAVEVVCPSSSRRSEITADILLLESEKQQNETMKHPQTEVKVVRERVISKSRDLRFTVFLMPAVDIV